VGVNVVRVFAETTKLAAPFEPHTETAVRPSSRPSSVQSTYRTSGPFGTSEGRPGPSSTSSARAASARGSLATVTAASKLVGNLAKIRSASARPSGTGAHRGQPKAAAAAAAKEPEPAKPTNAVLASGSAPDADVGDGMGCTLPFNRALVMLEVLHLLGPQVRPGHKAPQKYPSFPHHSQAACHLGVVAPGELWSRQKRN